MKMQLFNDLSQKIELSPGFNRSTNLELDYEDSKRIKDIFISQKFETSLLEVLSTIKEEHSNERVRVLSGSPGLGKSTFALLLAGIVSKKHRAQVKKILQSNESENAETLSKEVGDFLKRRNSRLLPVFLNGYMGDIEKAFFDSLKQAVSSVAQEFESLQEEFDEIVLTASASFETIQNWKKNYPKAYASYVEFLNDEGVDQNKFEKSLKRGAVSAQVIFAKAFSVVTGGAQASNATESVIDVYKKSCELLREYGFSGIFVIYDEFGKYLEQGIHQPSKLNIQFLQNFAEYCDRSGASQCHLTLITHMSVSQYATRLPIEIQKEWAKIEGRFQETAFYDKSTSYYHLIARVFNVRVKDSDPKLGAKVGKILKQYQKDLVACGEGMAGFVDSPDFVEQALSCYPLHPVSLAMLPMLSHKVAQNERTLYTFLTRNEAFSLPSFLNAGYGASEIPFLGIHDLYKYFSSIIVKDTGVGGTYRIALLMEDQLNAIPDDQELQKEILCLVALCEVIKNQRFFPTTKSFIANSLSVEFEKKDVEKALKELVTKKALYYNKISKTYVLQQGSSIDIPEEIEKLKSKKLTSKDLVGIIKGFSQNSFIIPKKYNYENSITRFLRTEIVSVDQLNAANWPPSVSYGSEDGVLYYVVPFSQDELEDAKKLIKERTEKLVLYVLPNDFVECKSDIEELNAINELYNNKDIITTGPLVKKELDRHKQITMAAINGVLSSLIGSFSLDCKLIYNPTSVSEDVVNYVRLQTLVGKILEREYFKYVPVNSELINKHKVSSSVTMARNSLVNSMLSDPSAVNFNIEGNGPNKALLNVMKNVAKYSFDEKENAFSFGSQIFVNLFEDYRKAISENSVGINYKDLSERFIAPPYGIRKAVLPLFMAFWDRALPDQVNHYTRGSYVTEIDGSHYELMMKHPSANVIQMTILDTVQQGYLERLYAIFNVSGDCTVKSVVQGILDWRKGIPNYVKLSSETPLELKNLLIQVDSAKEPDRLLFLKVPECFEMKAITSSSEQSGVDALIGKIDEVSSKARDIYRDLLVRMREKLVSKLQLLNSMIFEDSLNLDVSSLASSYQLLFKKLSDEVQHFDYSKETNVFLNRINSFDSNLEKAYFIENVGDAVTGINPRHWTEKTESLFNYGLDKAVEEITHISLKLDNKTSGENFIAYLDYNSGEKSYVNLGSRTTLSKKSKTIKEKISSELLTLGREERRSLLVELLADESQLGGGV